MKIIVRRDHFNGQYDRTYAWVAMRQHDAENIDGACSERSVADTVAGHGATPLEAVNELLWYLDLEDDTPYCMELHDP